MSEDTKGIPDVQGLQQFVEATMETGQSVKEKTEAKVETPPVQPDLAQFKTPEDLLKAYKEIQGAFTRTSQENKALKEQFESLHAQMKEQQELSRFQARPPVQPTAQQDFDQMFINNPEQAVVSKAQQVVAGQILQARIQEALEEEELKNPAEFQERYYFAKIASQRYPQLVTSKAGVKKLFELADKVRVEESKKQAMTAVKRLFGEDIDVEKFAKLIKRDAQTSDNNGIAYMPDTTSSSRTGAESGQGVPQSQAIHEAVNKGDVDTVLKQMFAGLK